MLVDDTTVEAFPRLVARSASSALSFAPVAAREPEQNEEVLRLRHARPTGFLRPGGAAAGAWLDDALRAWHREKIQEFRQAEQLGRCPVSSR